MFSTDDLAWAYCCNHLMACTDRPKMLLPNIQYHVCTRLNGVTTQTTLWILTTASTSNPVPKIIKNWNIDGNITLGKLNYSWAVYFLHTIYCQILFFHQLWTLLFITSQKLRKETILNINTHFMIRTTYDEFQTSATIIPQGKITCDHEIKQHIWHWKAQEDCSGSEIPCVILIAWMTVTTT